MREQHEKGEKVCRLGNRSTVLSKNKNLRMVTSAREAKGDDY